MTTATAGWMTYPTRGFPVKRLLLVGLVAFFAGVLLSVDVVHRDHALIKHGVEADAIRIACHDPGPDQVWRSQSWRTPNKIFLIVKLKDGRWGLQIRDYSKSRCHWYEVTSFVPKDGTLKRVVEYVSARADKYLRPLSELVIK